MGSIEQTCNVFKNHESPGLDSAIAYVRKLSDLENVEPYRLLPLDPNDDTPTKDLLVRQLEEREKKKEEHRESTFYDHGVADVEFPQLMTEFFFHPSFQLTPKVDI